MVRISTSRSWNSFSKWLFSREHWALKIHFEAHLTQFLQIDDVWINSSCIDLLPISTSRGSNFAPKWLFVESNDRSKTSLKRFWPNFIKLRMAKLIHYHRFESNFHFEAFFNQLLQVDFTKFTIRISLNSNLESLSFKFSLKASFCQKQFAPKSYFNLDFLYKFPESNSAKRILSRIRFQTLG